MVSTKTLIRNILLDEIVAGSPKFLVQSSK